MPAPPPPRRPALRLLIPVAWAAPLWILAAVASRRDARVARFLAEAGLLVMGAVFYAAPVMPPAARPLQRALGVALMLASALELWIVCHRG